MKLQVITLLALITCHKVLASEAIATGGSAASEDFLIYDEEDEDSEYVVPLPAKIEIWEYVPLEKDALKDADPNPMVSPAVEEEAVPTQWSIMTYLGSFFQPGASSPFKKSESLPLIEASEVNLAEMAANFNCQTSQLAKIKPITLERINPHISSSSSRVSILNLIARHRDNDLFELFYTENAALIMSEVKTQNEFHDVVFNCIKMDNINAFFNVMISPKFPLNGPQAIILASVHGSIKILEFILQQRDVADYQWVWKHLDGSDGYMLFFGPDPLSAALFFGALKTIQNKNLDCLQVLIGANVDLVFKNYELLKEAANQGNLDIFTTVHSSITTSIPDSIMNDVLLIAIKKNDGIMVNYLLALQYDYRIKFQQHLLSAIPTKNPVLVEAIMHLVPAVLTEEINSNILNVAADSGNVDIFLSLVKVSSSEVILSALCSCILNERYHQYVPLIGTVVKLTSDQVSQALIHSVRIGSDDFVELFLSESKCTVITAKPAFMAAMESNCRGILLCLFTYKFKKAELLNMRPKNLTAVIEKLFENQAWESLSFFVENFLDAPDFPKYLFMAIIMETDQVKIAQQAVEFGFVFPQSKLADVKNARMRDLVLSQASVNSLAKSQQVKRK